MVEIIEDKRIALFSLYTKRLYIKKNIFLYLNELLNHFNKLIIISNNLLVLRFVKLKLNNEKIITLLVKNEGMDFGMYYNVFKKFNFTNIEVLCLANDSCFLINPLDDVIKMSEQYDYFGVTASNEIKYHIQSYFLILNQKSIDRFRQYLLSNGIKKNYNEVVTTYEIGFSQKLIDENFKIGAYFEFPESFKKNPTYFKIDELIIKGASLIKKNMLLDKFNRDIKQTLIRDGLIYNLALYKELIDRFARYKIDI